MKLTQIFSITPAPYGDDYRLVETFDTLEQALKVKKVLEEVNVSHNVYRVMEYDTVKGTVNYDSFIFGEKNEK